ncbi:hypothetical protein ACROYT_G039899 [Oculina patagonica]
MTGHSSSGTGTNCRKGGNRSDKEWKGGNRSDKEWKGGNRSDKEWKSGNRSDKEWKGGNRGRSSKLSRKEIRIMQQVLWNILKIGDRRKGQHHGKHSGIGEHQQAEKEEHNVAEVEHQKAAMVGTGGDCDDGKSEVCEGGY